MKIKFYLSFFIILFCTNVFALQKDTMFISKNKFVLSGVEMNFKQALEVMQDVPEAYQLMKKARNNNAIASAFGFITGFSIGVPLGQALGGGEPEWGIAVIGGGALIVAIPFMIKTKKLSKFAVRKYNQEIVRRN
jgi:hypothetical protein